MSFSSGFTAGMNAREMKDKRDEEKKLKAELQTIADAKPEQSQGYTAEQGADLEAAAARGDKVDVQYKDDGQGNQVFDRYVVSPQASEGQAAPQSRDVAMQGVTDFMGQRTAGNMSAGQVSNAKTMAMAGVVKKYDPVRGMQMEQSATNAQRDEQRFGREQKGWEKQDDEAKRALEHRTERDEIMKNSPLGQYQAAMAKSAQEQSAYNEAIKAGKSPQELGLPPQKPNIQRPGPMQVMAGYAGLIMLDYKYDKLSTDGLIQFQDKFQTLEKENYSKAMLVAQSGGTPDQIAKAFNSAGMQIDPQNVTVTRTKQTNGPDQVMLNYKDDKGRETSLNVMAELESYDKAKQVFDRFYQSEGNRRGNEQLQLSKNADGRAGAAASREQNEKTEKANAAVDLFKQRNPNATATELQAVRKGVIDINPDTKNAPSEVKLAQAMVNAGLAPDMRSGLEMAITKKTQDPGEMHKGFVSDAMKNPINASSPEKAVASADKVMETMGYTKGNGRWSLPKGQAAGQADAPVKVGTMTDQQKLAKGTRYIAPDGTIRIKQ